VILTQKAKDVTSANIGQNSTDYSNMKKKNNARACRVNALHCRSTASALFGTVSADIGDVQRPHFLKLPCTARHVVVGAPCDEARHRFVGVMHQHQRRVNAVRRLHNTSAV
jgi:hypothetical protein